MRYDLIDLKGEFKINGITGSDGKGLGFSGSTIDWIDSASVASVGNLSKSGYNYLIVSATGSPTENAANLRSVSDQANGLFAPSQTDQVTILIMPGVYDFSDAPLIPYNYFNYVGISTNPYDTIFSNSSVGSVIDDNSDAQWGLENIHLKGDGYCRSGSPNLFWRNVVVGGITFDSSNAWGQVCGVFKDIRILDLARFAVCTGEISGTFSNIIGGNLLGAFITTVGGINGTFENIEIVSVNQIFKSQTYLFGNYKNINISIISSDSFVCGNGSLNMNCDNIKIGASFADNFTCDGPLYGRYKNFYIGNFGNIFISPVEIEAEFTNINLGEGSGSIFTSPSLSLKIDTLNVGNCQNIFTINSGATLKVKNVNFKGGNFVLLPEINANLDAEFENLNLDTNFFIQGDGGFLSTNMDVKLKNSKISFEYFIVNFNNLNCEIDNVMIYSKSSGSQVTTIGNNINLRINNFECKNTIGGFGNINGYTYITASNVKFGNLVNGALSAGSELSGTLYNCKFGDIGGDLIYNSSVKIDIYGLKAGNVTYRFYFSNNGPIIDRKCIDVFVGDVQWAFSSPDFGSYNNHFENITIGNCTNDFFTVADSFDGYYKNIKGKIVGGYFFSKPVSGGAPPAPQTKMKGSYKNFEIEGSSNSFQFYYNDIQGARLENIKIGNSNIFFGTRVQDKTSVRNLYIKGAFGDEETGFFGSLENSFIDSLGTPQIYEFRAYSVIKRSTILSDYEFNTRGFVYLSRFNSLNQSSSINLFNNIIANQ